MKPYSLALSGIALAITGSVSAHSPVSSTHPADGSSLEAVPEMLHMNFARPARVTKLMMTYTGEQGQTETRLEVPSSGLSNELHLTPAFPGTGSYSIDWRALGEDGHVMNGTFSFSVR